jgi:DNA topoisomerase I
MKTADEIGLSGGEYKLYQMIWKRTMATQMADALLRFDTVTITVEDAEFRASGRTVEFAGFFRAYVEGSDDPDAAIEDQDSPLPPLAEKDKVDCQNVDAIAHETKPPARFTEATLVKSLESEGIGRPSTYASILSTIQDRGYVRKNGNQLVPTFTAMAVTKLLEGHFPNLVDFGFTAGMEQTLDDIATGAPIVCLISASSTRAKTGSTNRSSSAKATSILAKPAHCRLMGLMRRCESAAMVHTSKRLRAKRN